MIEHAPDRGALDKARVDDSYTPVRARFAGRVGKQRIDGMRILRSDPSACALIDHLLQARPGMKAAAQTADAKAAPAPVRLRRLLTG